jgi:hypothetical protein
LKLSSPINNIYFLIIILFAIIVRLTIIIISDFNQTVLFIGGDAWGLHLAGLDVANWENINFFSQTKIPYISLLAYTYKYIYPSYLIGASISLFFYFLSLLYFIKILNLIEIKQKNILILLIFFCFLPTIIIYTSATIREPIQLFLTNIMIFYVLKIHLTSRVIKTVKYFFILIFFTFMYYLTHRIGPIFGFINIIIGIFLIVLKINVKKVYLLSFILLIILIFSLSFLFVEFFAKNYSFEQFQQGYIKAIEIYQNGLYLSSPLSRANYFELHNFESIADIMIFLLTAFIKYNFEPLFSLNKFIIKDSVLIFENILRLFFYMMILFFIFLRKLSKNTHFIIIFSVFILNELIWSVGTNNWGTASRHHIPSIGLMLISVALILKTKSNEKK